MSNLAATSTMRLAAVARAAASARSRKYGSALVARNFGMRPVYESTEIPPAHTIDTVKPPSYWSSPDPEDPDPMAYVRKPVTSAQMVDVTSNPPKLSDKDMASLSPLGAVVHGTFGELDAASVQGIPLEYLALLRPSAEGAAALRTLSEKAGHAKGTLLVFGATQPAGLSAVQLGTASGHSVVAVVGGEHSGNEDMCDIVKGLTKEPGFMVPEEYAMIKQSFKELVMDAASGNTKSASYDSEKFLSDFKQNLLDYIATYPETLPAAVDKEELIFQGKDKDRTYFRENMEAYLEQFPSGAPQIPEQDLVEKFPKEQYAIWKSKFAKQSTSIISGDETGDFNPAEIVKYMINNPEKVEKEAAGAISYEFSVLNQPTTEARAGGSVIGAIIAVTPFLKNACEAVDKAKTLREKAEALQFLPVAERNAFAAASSVAALAKSNGVGTLVVGGSLSGFESVEPTKDDAASAIASMDIQDDGSSDLNHFVQVYRAGDFPIYADYAVHRATEVLAGPRQAVVTK